jgi:pyruvate/2-oxoglutarate dehydrogenase complex dihydrolipoamide dehydrogenase (E3) component
VALVGGGLTSCELALHLANEGKKVYIINRRDRLAYHEKIMMFMFNPVPIMMRDYALYERPVEAFNDLDCKEVLDDGVRCQFKDGTEKVIKADTVVFASGMRANSDEAAKFLGLAPYVRTIGDCRMVGKIKHCVTSGYYAAIDIDK